MTIIQYELTGKLAVPPHSLTRRNNWGPTWRADASRSLSIVFDDGIDRGRQKGEQELGRLDAALAARTTARLASRSTSFMAFRFGEVI